MAYGLFLLGKTKLMELTFILSGLLIAMQPMPAQDSSAIKKFDLV